MPILTLIGAITICGYYLGLGSKKLRLPSLIGYMVLRAILGTSGFDLLGEEKVRSLSFKKVFSDIGSKSKVQN